MVDGRLQFAQIPEEVKHQIIIPHNDPVIEKLIMHIHVKAARSTSTILAYKGKTRSKASLQASENPASSRKKWHPYLLREYR